MTEQDSSTEQPVGQAAWLDLTVDDAVSVRDFYASVVGFETSTVDMGDWQDFCLHPPNDDTPVAGVCHKRGGNKDQPGGWMPYFTVADLKASLAEVTARGGRQVTTVRNAGNDQFCVIADPSGAMCALYQKG